MSQDGMDIDAPSTPIQRHIDPFQRPATTAPLHARETTRQATPLPRYASARPNFRPPTAHIHAPLPQRPSQTNNDNTNGPPRAYDGTPHMARTPSAAPERPYARHPAPPRSPDPILEEVDDVLVTTPTPQGGWKEIQGKKPLWQFEKLNEHMARAWKDTGIPRCLVATAGEGACDNGELARRNLQKEVIMRKFGFTPRIYQAQAATAGGKRNDDPPCNLVLASYPGEIKQLLDAKCVSVRGGPTLFFFPIDPPFPSLMAIYAKPEAFGTSGNRLATSIRDRLSRPLYYDRITSVFQRELELPNAPTDLSPNDLAGILLDSITTKEATRTWRKVDTPLVSVYCNVPTTNEDTWYAIRHIFRTARLGTDLSGQPVLYTDPMKCGICRGVEHDTAMCQLPSINKWYGPLNGNKHDDDEVEETQQDRTTQRGHRGFAGRGRGGRPGYGHRGGFR